MDGRARQPPLQDEGAGGDRHPLHRLDLDEPVVGGRSGPLELRPVLAGDRPPLGVEAPQRPGNAPESRLHLGKGRGQGVSPVPRRNGDRLDRRTGQDPLDGLRPVAGDQQQQRDVAGRQAMRAVLQLVPDHGLEVLPQVRDGRLLVGPHEEIEGVHVG